jgi:phosphoglycerate dehydrogenase-like enzyme
MPFHCSLTADFLNPQGALVYKDIGLGVLRDAGIGHAFFEAHEPEVTPAQLAGSDAVISLTPRYTAASFEGVADRLLAVVRFGVGYDMVDVEACTRAGVALCITRGAVNHSVAEAILTWMLALSHRLVDKDRLVRGGRWAERANFMGGELRHRTLGLIGAGGIGGALVRLLSGFRMNTPLVFDPYLSEEAARDLGVRKTGLDTLMSEADFISVNCPLTDETRGLIGAQQIARMKPTAFLINTARGGIVDEPALADALRRHRIAGAATDVFDTEPADGSHVFAGLDNILLAPHCIAWTDDLFAEIGHMAARATADLSRGIVPEALLVNPKVLQHPGFLKKLATHTP